MRYVMIRSWDSYDEATGCIEVFAEIVYNVARYHVLVDQKQPFLVAQVPTHVSSKGNLSGPWYLGTRVSYTLHCLCKLIK